MKIVTLAAAGGAALALSATAAAAQDSGWYVRGDVGANVQSKLGGAPSVKGDTGWAADVGVGRDLGNGFRTEGELLYFQGSAKNSPSGDLQTVAGLLNGYYDFNRDGAWRPFVGAGLGVGQVKVTGGGPFAGDDTGLAYQLKAGVSHPFNERLSGEVAYRYFGVNGLKIGTGASRIAGDFNNQAVTVGLRYKFGL